MAAVTCVITGQSNIGKTALAMSLTAKDLPSLHEETVFDNFSGQVLMGNKPVTVSIFDTAGKVAHKDVRHFCYDNSDVIIVTYSTVNRESFIQARDVWLPEALKWKRLKKCAIQLVGLQMNTSQEKQVASIEEIETVMRKFKVDSFHVCSVLEKTGVDEIFKTTVNHAMKRKLSLAKRIIRLFKPLGCLNVME